MGGGRITLKPTILLTEKEIRKRVRELGRMIKEAYRNIKDPLVVIGVLKGSFVFMSDLIREIKIPLRCDFLGLSSYGDSTRTTGEVKVTFDLTYPIKGEHCLIVDDIIDTGITMDYLLRLLSARQPASLKLCVLLDKKENRIRPITIHFKGFEIPNRFVMGYGLDYYGTCRNLPYIGYFEDEL